MSYAHKKVFHLPVAEANAKYQFGGSMYFGRSLGLKMSQDLFIGAIRAGFNVHVVEALSKNIDLPEKVLAAYAAISPRTLSRRKEQGKLSPNESDRMARIGLVVDEATDLFKGDAVQAAQWVKSAKKALGGASPLEYIDTEIGYQEVRDLIGRIKHGVFS